MVDRDSVVSETENTIEFTKGKCESGLLGSLGKVLVLDAQVTDSDGVLRNESLKGARSVLDGELGTVSLVGRRLGGVVLGVKLDDELDTRYCT